jgi:hypothetical protein
MKSDNSLLYLAAAGLGAWYFRDSIAKALGRTTQPPGVRSEQPPPSISAGGGGIALSEPFSPPTVPPPSGMQVVPEAGPQPPAGSAPYVPSVGRVLDNASFAFLLAQAQARAVLPPGFSQYGDNQPAAVAARLAASAMAGVKAFRSRQSWRRSAWTR